MAQKPKFEDIRWGVDTALQIKNGFSGGSRPSTWNTPCPGQPPVEDVALMLQEISDVDLESLRAIWRLNPPSDMRELPVNSPYDMAKTAMGGSDCKLTGGDTRFQQAFLRMIAKYTNPEGTMQSVGKFDGDKGGWERVKDAAKGVGKDLLKTGKEVVVGAVEGAASGASASAKGAATGAHAGSFLTSTTFTVIAAAGAGFGLVWLIKKAVK
jgi:hypothetical protein